MARSEMSRIRLGRSPTVAAVRNQHIMTDPVAVIAQKLDRLIEGSRGPLWHEDGTPAGQHIRADTRDRVLDQA
jgi:hypothetical protein